MLPVRLLRPVTILSLLLTATAASGQATRPSAGPTSRPEDKPQDRFAYVLMTTSMGEIVIELDQGKAPITVANFLSYTDKEFYDGTIYHRVIPGFMIQGGGLSSDMVKKRTDAPIKNEWLNGLTNKRGSIAMARTNAPDSATAQFFINVVNNPNLDGSETSPGYAVFGQVVAGMDVVDKIRYVPTTMKNGRRDVPVETVLIEKVRRMSPADAKKRKEKAQAEASEKKKEEE